MKLITAFMATVLLGTALLVGVGTSKEAVVYAHEESTTDNQAADDTADLAPHYDYVAQPSDSYTLMARKAIQTYGKKSEVNLSPAKIIYAETNLTVQAGSPSLSVDQEVDIDESSVEDWVNKAQELTDAEESAWDHYVQFVNFNTDTVGQAS